MEIHESKFLKNADGLKNFGLCEFALMREKTGLDYVGNFHSVHSF